MTQEKFNRKKAIKKLQTISGYILHDMGTCHGTREFIILSSEGEYQGSGWGECFSDVMGPVSYNELKLSVEKYDSDDYEEPESNPFIYNEEEDLREMKEMMYELAFGATEENSEIDKNKPIYYAYNGTMGEQDPVFLVSNDKDDLEQDLLAEQLVGCEFTPWEEMDDEGLATWVKFLVSAHR